jgi:hypothetical protein
MKMGTSLSVRNLNRDISASSTMEWLIGEFLQALCLQQFLGRFMFVFLW